MKDLYIVGAGSVGGYVATNFEAFQLRGVSLKGFLDDDPNKQGKTFCGLPVLGPVSILESLSHIAVVMGIAFPSVKEKLYSSYLLDKQRFEFPTLVSPAAWLSRNVTVDCGSIIYPGCAINYATSIGAFVVMNMNCAIGHDCTIGAFSSLAPGVNLGGNTQVGIGCEIGIGASTMQFTSVGNYAKVGGQAMVTKDVPEKAVVVGVPAKALKDKD